MKIRSPIVSVLGHVDHGKTTLLDYIRGSAIANKEAGGITQHIGATGIPIDVINEICEGYLNKVTIKDTIKGLLFIDTPGHEAFTSIRKRGGSLADLAILIVDLQDGFKPQTLEALNILKLYKTPFIIAANKVDKLFGWESHEELPFAQSLAKQPANTQQALDNCVYELVGKLHQEGFSSERFDRVTDFASQIAIVPLSAKTGEGIKELLTMLMGLAQQYLQEQLLIEENSPGKCTILELKTEKGLGKTIDALIYDGVIKKNDEIAVVTSSNEIITTKIRSLLKPKPLEEMKESKCAFEQINELTAAGGVKIVAPGIDDVMSGSPLRVIRDTPKETIFEKILEELQDFNIETDDDGILVKADTIGSLEALVMLLKDMDIPINSAEIGDITKNDIVNASIIKKSNPEHGVIIAFNVKIHQSVEDDLKKEDLKLFQGEVIYQLIEDYQNWLKERKDKQQKLWLDAIIRPAVIRSIPKLVFRQSKPAILGIEVIYGSVKQGYNLMDKNGNIVGTVESMEHNGDTVQVIKRGQKIAMAIKNAIVGKDFEEGDELYVDIPEKHYKILTRELKNKLTDDENIALDDIVKIKRLNNPEWGELGLFEFE